MSEEKKDKLKENNFNIYNAIEVLVTTMNKTTSEMVELANKMSIKSNAIIRCQSASLPSQDITIFNNGYKLRLIIANDKGLSINRNSLLAVSTGEYILFADDDEIFMDDYADKILKDFNNDKSLDCIEYSISRNYARPANFRNQKARLRHTASYGVWSLVIKRSALIEKGICFDERIGPGADVYCGEDTLFKSELFKNKFNYWTSSFILVHNENREISSWYTGENERVFLSRSIIYGMCHKYAHLIYVARMMLLKKGYKYTSLKKAVEASKIGVRMKKNKRIIVYWNNEEYVEK